MSLEALKKEVYEANMELVEKQLVISTWGNVSGYDEESGLMVIKPSGVPYKELRPDQMVPVESEWKCGRQRLCSVYRHRYPH